MGHWVKFLETLSTRGGAILLLLIMNGVGVFVAMHLIHHNEMSSTAATTLLASFSGFNGALLIALKVTADSSASVTSHGVTATAGPTAGTDAVKTDANVVDDTKKENTDGIKRKVQSNRG
jgi:FtsH-binding integral membrane protein